MNFLMRTEARTNKRTIRGRKAKKNLWNIMWNFYNLISSACLDICGAENCVLLDHDVPVATLFFYVCNADRSIPV